MGGSGVTLGHPSDAEAERVKGLMEVSVLGHHSVGMAQLMLPQVVRLWT
jgi:hypothetical protein